MGTANEGAQAKTARQAVADTLLQEEKALTDFIRKLRKKEVKDHLGLPEEPVNAEIE